MCLGSALQPHISRDRRSLGADDHFAISYSCVSVVRCSLTYPVTEGRWGADDHLAISYSCVSVVRCSLTYPVTEGRWGDDHDKLFMCLGSASSSHIP